MSPVFKTLHQRWITLKRRGRAQLLASLFLLLCFLPSLLTAQIAVSTPASESQTASQWVSQGQARYRSGQFAEAATAWQQAANAYAQAQDPLNQAMALGNLSLTDQQLEQWESSKQALTQSLNLLNAQPQSSVKKSVLAATLDIRGQLELSTGDFESALQTWQQAGELHQKTGRREAVIANQINQAQAMQSLGLYPRACQTLTEALGLQANTCEEPSASVSIRGTSILPSSLQTLGLRSLGNVFRTMGQPEKSRAALKQSLQLADPDPAEQAANYLALGNTARARGNRSASSPAGLKQAAKQPINCLSEFVGTVDDDYQQAAMCYRQAIEVSPTTALPVQLNLLSLMVQTLQRQEISDLLPVLQTKLDALAPSRSGITARLKFAQTLMCLHGRLSSTPSPLKPISPVLQSCTAEADLFPSPVQVQVPDWSVIQQVLDVALQQAQVLGDRKLTANALGYQANVAYQQGRTPEAEQLTERALQQIAAFNAPELAYLWQWQLGRLYQLQDKTPQAISSYSTAFDLLQSLRRDLVTSDSDVQFAFRDSIEPVYRELVALLLNNNAPSQAYLKQARDVIESLQLAELNNFFQEACLDAHPQLIDQFDSKAAVIYSIILPSRLAVIVSLPGQPLRYYPTELSAAQTDSGADNREVDKTVKNLFATLNPFVDDPNPLQPQQKIYDWLVRPAAAELEKSQIKTLVFVLDGALRSIPVAVLHDGKQFLVEQYAIALTPGLELLRSRTLSPEKLRILAGGLSVARDGFTSLPGVKQEMTDISGVFPTETLLNGEFTRQRLRAEIDRTTFPVVHLATHAQFSSRAEDTFLLTWSERINVKNLDSLLSDRVASRNPIELLILSACQTAVGDKRATLGLAGVAVRSGARSTIATLWAVQDQSTADLMVQLYKALNQPHTSKADALRQGQLALLHSKQYQHPYYWAPFVLVGKLDLVQPQYSECSHRP